MYLSNTEASGNMTVLNVSVSPLFAGNAFLRAEEDKPMSKMCGQLNLVGQVQDTVIEGICIQKHGPRWNTNDNTWHG